MGAGRMGVEQKGRVRYQRPAAVLTDGTYRTYGTYMTALPISPISPIGLIRCFPKMSNHPNTRFRPDTLSYQHA